MNKRETVQTFMDFVQKGEFELAKTKLTVKEGKIKLWVVEPTDGAGLEAVLHQLETELQRAEKESL